MSNNCADDTEVFGTTLYLLKCIINILIKKIVEIYSFFYISYALIRKILLVKY
jgi:hypothetical protein